MRKREEREIRKHTLNLYAGDYEKLQALYSSRIGAAKVIRDLVHAHLITIKDNAALREPLLVDLGLEELEMQRSYQEHKDQTHE